MSKKEKNDVPEKEKWEANPKVVMSVSKAKKIKQSESDGKK